MFRCSAVRPLLTAILLALGLVMPVLGVPVAAAADAATWSVQPATATGPDPSRSRFDFLDIEPGQRLLDHVAVHNRGSTDLTLRVYASDAITTANGGFDLLPAEQSPVAGGSWVMLATPEVSLAPGQAAIVPFTITVPQDASPGEHAGGIVAALVVPATGTDGTNVDVHYRVGVRIYLRVAGPLTPALEIDDVVARYEGGLNPLELGDLHVGWTVRNTGNVRLSGAQLLRVSGPFGITLATGRLEDLPELLPGASISLDHVRPDLLPLILLGARIAIRPVGPAGLELPPLGEVSGTADAWAVPWLLVVGAAIGMAYVARRWRRRRTRGRAHHAAAAVAIVALVSGGCAPADHAEPGTAQLDVQVTHAILADLVARVGGERVRVSSIIPPGGDPHTYEPTQADARRLAGADLAFTNGMLLEEHSLIKLFDTVLRPGTPSIAVLEAAERYGARLRPMEERIDLDVVWLGIAVRSAPDGGPRPSADVVLRAVDVDGPGSLRVYVTDSFGIPRAYIDSADGLDDADRIVLPPGAHTHVNWAFDAPGVYAVALAASLNDAGTITDLGRGTFRFAVGVDPDTVAGPRDVVIRDGHADVGVDLATGRLFGCASARSCVDDGELLPAERVVVDVPDRAIIEVPDNAAFAFLGDPGTRIWELPQAVLGRHVHGPIDPHAWHDIGNVQAFAWVIADALAAVDPAGRAAYERRRDAFVASLDLLHAEIGEQLASIPPGHRFLVTTHDAFGYLADAYGFEIGGFVVPNPGQQPSVEEVRRLTERIRALRVPAVFLEPNLQARASVLRQVAQDEGVEVCVLYGDAFGGQVQSYEELMRHNAAELARCLSGER